MAYRYLITDAGAINTSELMLMAHRRAKAGMVAERAAATRFGHAPRSYAAEFAEALAYFWMWAKALREEFPRRVVAAPVQIAIAA